MQKLTNAEKESLKQQHKKERDKRVCDRIKAVLLYDKGWTCTEIAEALLLTDEAIRLHIHDYETFQKLKPENGGSQSKMNAHQAQLLKTHLEKHTYLYVKDIVAYVLAIFKIEYTVAGMHSWLKANGFVYKKPAVVPGKANGEAQEQWIERYVQIKEKLGAEDVICFIDGVHPTHNPKVAYGWIKKGERKEIPTNTGRQRINLTGAVNIVSRKVLIEEDTTLNANSTINFLIKIEEAYPKASIIHVFCDNARYYRNKSVTEFLKSSKIIMHFLPPYSPNLNPIERLWKFTNERLLYNKYYEKFADFKKEVLGFLEGLFDPPKDILDALISRITDNFQVVARRPNKSSI